MSYEPIPLVDMDSSLMDPLPRRRKPKSSSSTDPPLRFLLVLALLATLGLASFYTWIHGLPALKKLSKSYNPHAAQHAIGPESLKESEVVRSLFGPAREGGIDRFDLVASIYVLDRKRKKRPVNLQVHGSGNLTSLGGNGTSNYEARSSISLVSSSSSSNGAVGSSKRPAWERVWSEVVMRDLDVRTSSRQVVANAVLPGRVIASLQEHSWGAGIQMKADFHLQPSASISPFDLIPFNSTHYLSTLNTTMRGGVYYSRADKFPLPYPAVGKTVEDQKNETTPWPSRLPGSSPVNLLLVNFGHYRPRPLEPEPENDEDVEEDDGTTVNEPSHHDMSSRMKSTLVSRSTVTLVSDFPTYDLALFKKKMNVLKNRQAKCMRQNNEHWGVCRRSFNRHGHFENLLEMGSLKDLADFDARVAEATESSDEYSDSELIEEEKEVSQKEPKGWRYAPYVVSDYGNEGDKNYVDIPTKANASSTDEADQPLEVSDFAFNWTISFVALSPVRFSTASQYLQDGRISNILGLYSTNDEAHSLALIQDKTEILNSLLGHPFDPNSRPFLRFLLRQLANAFFYASIVLSGHYWFTRSYSTGISISAHAIDTLVRVILFFISAAFRKGQRLDFVFAPVVLFAASLVWTLAAKLEWSWGGWVPVGVTRRKSTHAERTSSRLDFKFGWSQRALATILAYLIFLYLPSLPDLIAASPPVRPSLSPASLSFIHDLASTSLTRFIIPTFHTSRFIVFLAQSLLNHRSKTFGGSHKIVAFLEFGTEVLASLPIVLSSRWGRWELMDPWKVTNLIEVVMRGVLVWQAWKFVKVKQEEEEEE